MDRKKIIMIILVAVFVLAIIYRITHPFKQERVAQLTYTGKSSGRIIKKQMAPDVKNKSAQGFLKLDLLSEPPRHSPEVYTNIFNPQETMLKRSGGEEVKKQPPKQEEVAAVVESPTERIKQQIGNFNFLGSYKSGDNEIIFLGRGKQILPVRKGDRLDGKYRIEALSEKSITIRADSVDEPIMIQLSEL